MIRWSSNITYQAGQYPLVAILDCFFIIFIFFLISNSMLFWPGTKLDTSLALPKVAEVQLQEADKLVITVDRTGQIFFNELECKDLQQLEQTLGNVLVDASKRWQNRHHATDETESFDHSPCVVLKADRNITYETLSQIITIIRNKKLKVLLLNDMERQVVHPSVNFSNEP